MADAVGRGDMKQVEGLLKHPKIDHRKGGKDWASPLLYACKYGHTAIVALFLERNLADFDEEEVISTTFEGASRQTPERTVVISIYHALQKI